MTGMRIFKGVLAFAPVTGAAIHYYQSNGGGLDGITKGALPTFTKAYTGINAADPENVKFEFSGLMLGYAPAVGAVIAGKVMNRLRVL
jgi:hypothetical protein